MSDTTPIEVPETPTHLSIALGKITDAAGDVLANDTFDPGSVEFGISDATLVTVETQDAQAGTASLTTTGLAGSFTVNVVCTVGGVSVTGTSPVIDVQAGPPTTIEVDVTVG